MTEETYENAALVLTRTKYYSGVFEREITEANGVTTEREINFIFAPDGLAAIYEKKNGNMYYVSTDNLGSINIIANAQGNIVNDLSYDAWGRRRNPYTWEQLTVAQTKALQPTLITDRGYTLHEHMDAFGLINMNGRAYDPLVGQFLSPDPFVQSATSSQSYNRYSYCWNNPLKFVDPSGYTSFYVDGMMLSERQFGLFWQSSALNGFENIENTSVGGFSSSYGSQISTAFSRSMIISNQSEVFKKNYFFATQKLSKGTRVAIQGYNKGYAVTFDVAYGKGTTYSDYGYMTHEEAVLLRNVLNSDFKLKDSYDGPYSSRVLAQAWENNEDNFWRDHNKIPHNPQPQLRITGPDMQGVSIQLNGVLGAGPGVNLTIGRVYGDGWFMNVTNTFSAGSDLSFSISRIEGYYRGKGNATTKSLSGGYFYAEGSAMIFTGGYWGDVSNKGIGSNWQGKYYGISVGVTLISGASGIGITSDPYWFW